MKSYEFPPLLQPARTESARVSRLFAWWSSKRRSGPGFPRWSEIDLVELKDWAGWLIVYGIMPDVSDARYRLVGSRIVDRTGYDLTGRLVSEQTYTLTPELVLCNLRRVCAFGGASLQTNTLEVNRTGYARASERLWMPFSEDGKTIDRLMLYHDQVEDVVPQHLRAGSPSRP